MSELNTPDDVLVDKLRKVSIAVYLACNGDVADDLSELLKEAADTIAAWNRRSDQSKVHIEQCDFSNFARDELRIKLTDGGPLNIRMYRCRIIAMDETSEFTIDEVTG